MRVYHISTGAFLPFILVCNLIGCNTARGVEGGKGGNEQEMTRYRSVNPEKEPVIFGRVEAVDKSGPYALSTAILSLDKKLYFADGLGKYRLNITPGSHQFMVGQIGIYPYQFTLKIEPGDSLHIDFHLRSDLRPLN